MNQPLEPADTRAPIVRLDAGARFALGLALVVIALAIYLTTLSAHFVYDDHILIEGNRVVADLGEALRSFFEPLWSLDPEGEIQNAYWRPLTVLVIAATRHLAGLSPKAFHLLSLLLHILATWAAWRLASRLLRSQMLGWFAAALFVAHPVQVESVAWASALNDPLFALFALVSLERYLAWRERGAAGVPWSAGLWLVPALLSKEQALVIPVVALAIDFAFGHLTLRRRETRRLMLRSFLPWLVVIGLYFVGRMVAYGSPLAGLDQVSADFGLSLGRGLLLRVEIFGSFVKLLFLPLDTRLFRQVRPVLPEHYAPMLHAWIALLLWAVATAAAAWRKRRLLLAMLLAMPAGFVLILLDYEAGGAFPISDRYLYVSVLFAAVAVVRVLSRLLPRGLAPLAAVALTLLGAWRSSGRVDVFADDLDLFRAAVEAEPDNLRTQVGLGNVLLERYHQTLDKEYLDEALFHFLTGLMLGFDYGKYQPKLGPEAPWIKRAKELDILVNGVPANKLERDETVFISPLDRIAANLGLGESTLALGNLPPEYDLEWPQKVFEHILKRFPELPRALDGLGRTLFRQGRYEEAEKVFRRALAADRTQAASWHNLGLLLASQGRFDEGRACFDEALKLRPGNRKDLLEATYCAIDGKRFPQAEAYIQTFSRTYPGDPQVHYLRGMLRATRGDLAGAIEEFDRLLAKEENNASGHLQRAKALAGLGQRTEAIRAFKRAAALQPDNFEAHEKLAYLLLQNPEAQDEALPFLERAYLLSPPTAKRAELFGLLSRTLDRGSLSEPQTLQYLLSLARFDEDRNDFVHALSWVEPARVELEKERAARPDDPRLKRDLVFVLNMRGELFEGLAGAIEEQRDSYLVQARDSYLSGLEIEPEHFFLNYNLAVLLAAKLDRADQAIAYARKALEGIDALGDSPARTAVEEALRTIAEHKPQMGPFPDPGEPAQDR